MSLYRQIAFKNILDQPKLYTLEIRHESSNGGSLEITCTVSLRKETIERSGGILD